MPPHPADPQLRALPQALLTTLSLQRRDPQELLDLYRVQFCELSIIEHLGFFDSRATLVAHVIAESGQQAVLRIPLEQAGAQVRAQLEYADRNAGPRVLAETEQACLLELLPGPSLLQAHQAEPLEADLIGSVLRSAAAPMSRAMAAAGVPTWSEHLAKTLADSVVRAQGHPRSRTLIAAAEDATAALLALQDVSLQQMCHGDLSARNVFAGADGRWRLIDPQPHIGPAEADAVKLCSSLGLLGLLDPRSADDRGLSWPALDDSVLDAVRDWYSVTGELYRWSRRALD